MTKIPTPRLSRPEWAAVSLALIEADTGAGAPAPEPGSFRAHVDRAMRLFTGIERPPGLANPRLEAVRRFVCATRRRRRPAEEYVPELIAQGFSRTQIDALALLST